MDALTALHKCPKCSYSHPQASSQLIARCALCVVITTNTLPYLYEPRVHITPPLTPEQDHPGKHVDQPK